MERVIDLSGNWGLALDEEKKLSQPTFRDSIHLPGTTSYCKKGRKNPKGEIGCLTDEYKFEGYAWYSREVEIPPDLFGKKCFLLLERTRKTTVFIDDRKVGSRNSLCTPHVYDVSDQMTAGRHTLTVLVDNTDYPTKGGHLTSPDSQSNWNGITGRIELRVFNQAYISDVQVYPNVQSRSVKLKIKLAGTQSGTVTVSAKSFNGGEEHIVPEQDFAVRSDEPTVEYFLGRDAVLWNEHTPNLYRLKIALKQDEITVDTTEVNCGLREISTTGDKITVNGQPVFLRGKQECLNFPRTGFAPTGVDEWLRVFKIAKSYGINHYRCHTCCPPEAAFEAADLMGIYLEPELPFWGTVTDEGDENHNGAEQEFLVQEGYRILRCFGNHPSFVMFSLGNELWGSKKVLNSVLGMYKEYDCRHLYTQGSNNFQFCPDILENDDFFVGVRFSENRLIRGSYATCDGPLGHVQADVPGTQKDYDSDIVPSADLQKERSKSESQTIQIQVETGIKTVRTQGAQEEKALVPKIPVISHEIGQYAIYPNYKEIEKYTGPLKPKNFEIFRQRLEEKGLGDLAEKYFYCSGKLAVACYKDELETAFRSRKLAGFQLLDLQDYSGQGTALVGILDSFLDSKGLVSPEEWRTFCSDTVLLARFPKYNYVSGEVFHAHLELCCYRAAPLPPFTLIWKIRDDGRVYESGASKISDPGTENYIDICDINVPIPDTAGMKKLILQLKIEELGIEKSYAIWAYPKDILIDLSGLNVYNGYSAQVDAKLKQGENVILFAKPDAVKNSVKGFYCTDFWCYPMFRSISESMGKEVAVGTMGLLIQNQHPALKYFPCEEYSTYPWWHIIQNSCSVILDNTLKNFRPIVQTIDNFERNHKLGFLFECKVFSGNLLVCACDYEKLLEHAEGRQLLFSLFSYVRSGAFHPEQELGASLQSLFEEDNP